MCVFVCNYMNNNDDNENVHIYNLIANIQVVTSIHID